MSHTVARRTVGSAVRHPGRHSATYREQVQALARLCLEDRDPAWTCTMAHALAPSYPFLRELAVAMEAELAAAT